MFSPPHTLQVSPRGMTYLAGEVNLPLAAVEDDFYKTVVPVIQAAIILLIGVAIIVSNVLVIATLVLSPGERDAMLYYLLSLAFADLLCGILVVPLSIYPAVVQDWVYGDWVCRIEGYLEVSLWSVSVYTFMWIGVDRYLAIRKPLRYETIQTRTRCQCWMVFTWITATFLCCPPLLGIPTARYYREAYVCMLDWGNMTAYSVTLAALVLGPSVMTIMYTYAYVFYTARRVRGCVSPPDKEYASAVADVLENPNHLMSFVLVAVFWAAWLPWFALCAYEQLAGEVDMPLLHFCAVWVGILNCFWKTLIYILMNPKFRCGMRIFCASLCCRWKERTEVVVT